MNELIPVKDRDDALAAEQALVPKVQCLVSAGQDGPQPPGCLQGD